MTKAVLIRVWVFGCVLAASCAAATKAPDRIWVARADGALQCEAGSGETPERAAETLKKAGILVYSSRKGSDGQMRIQLCGSPTGTRNEIQIRGRDRAAAEKLGFTVLAP